MKIPLTLLLILFFQFSLFSQDQFESGYFIDSLGTKTECYILNKDWKDNPSQFSYKIQLNEEAKIRSTRETSEFGVFNKFKFIRFNVLIDKSSDQIDHLSNTRKPEFVKEQLFLKVLVEGKSTLYSYKRINLTRYFYSSDTIKIEQLVYKIYRHDGETAILKNETFKYQLKFNLACSESTEQLAENIKYKKKDLIHFFSQINSCQNSTFQVFDLHQQKDYFNLNVRPGIQLAQLSVSNIYTSIYDTKFTSEISFRLGVETEFILPFNNDKWSIITEPAFQYYSSEVTNSTQKAIIDYQSIELPIGLRYYFHRHNDTKFFINSSIIFDFPINSIIIWESFPDLKLELSNNINLGVGYQPYRRFSFELRYGLKRNILSRYLNWESNYNSFSLIMSYTIL